MEKINSAFFLTTVVFAVSRVALSQSGGSGSLQPGYTPVCYPQEYEQTPNPPFPTLPDQFSTVIEANILNRNSSFLAVEHYDYPGNRGRLETIFRGIDSRELAIFDYNLGEVFLIPDLERSLPCGVQLLTGPSRLLNESFGITYVNGKVHIGTVSQLFDLAVNESAQYMGVESIRGIPCNHWQTCHIFEDESYTLDYYFVSSQDWNYFFPAQTIPIQIVLNGSRFLNGTTDEFMDVYSFIAFHSGPSAVPDSVFEVPTGLPCLGRIAGKELPDVPPFFSMKIETLDIPNTISTVQEYYDRNLFRLDSRFNGTSYSFIHDFELSVEYIIDRSNSRCYVLPLENATLSFDMISGTNGTVQLPPTDFFRVGSGYNFSYEGETKIRGIEADAWISVRDSFPLSAETAIKNGTVEVFYSHPGWTSASSSDPIPLAINITGMFVNTSCGSDAMCGKPTKYSSFYNVFDFSSEEPEFDIFDTSFCATPGEYHILSLIIPGQESGLDLSQLRRGVRLGLAEWADIPPLQVANIKVLGENGTAIFVTLQILPLPSIARYTNPRTPDDILQEIWDNVDADDLLPFEIKLPSGDSVRPFLLRVNPNCPVPSPTSSVIGTTTIGSQTTDTIRPSTTTSSSGTTSTTPGSQTTDIITTTSSSGTTSTTPGSQTTDIIRPSTTTSSSGTTSTTPGSQTTDIIRPSTTTSSSDTTSTTPGSQTTDIIRPSTTTSSSGTTSTTPGTQESECPTGSSSRSSSGVSNGTAAGIAIAMFIVGMICALVLVLLIRYCTRRKSFTLKGDYRRQENEMEGFTD